ncbi:hypothetical protein CN246_08565 [Ethanoligenens harbinense]|nr:hypothetical protein CN246_08565 [Ethanoligenens harbinense]
MKVSTSGYYRWLACPESATKWENRKIYDVLKASYERNKGRTGLLPLRASLWCDFPFGHFS